MRVEGKDEVGDIDARRKAPDISMAKTMGVR